MIISRKTAHLFAGCAEIAALLGKSTPQQREALRSYGFNLGLAFQIVDDSRIRSRREENLFTPSARRRATIKEIPARSTNHSGRLWR